MSIPRIKLYSGVKLTNIYPGIDLKYYGNQGQLEQRLTVPRESIPESFNGKFQRTENKKY